MRCTGRCFPVNLWQAEIPFDSTNGTFNTSVDSYYPGANSYYAEDDLTSVGYSFRLPLDSECEYGENFIVYIIDESSGQAYYSSTFTSQNAPSKFPSGKPSAMPTSEPSGLPTAEPSSSPSGSPSLNPTSRPSFVPTTRPSGVPSSEPTVLPSVEPSSPPSSVPTAVPSSIPSFRPSGRPTPTMTIVSCPGELNLEAEYLGPYCSTNSALKNTLSCQFEICEGEIFTVSGVDTTAETVMRVFRSTGEEVVANAPYYDGPLSIELPLTAALTPMCELFEARLGCYRYDTSCQGSLNISGQGASIIRFSIISVSNYLMFD